MSKKKGDPRRTAFAILLGILFVSLLATVFLERMGDASSDLDTVTVYFKRSDGSTTSLFHLEVADTQRKRTRGLMYRTEESIPPNGGMFFAFPEQQVLQFWMKNTVSSLDMIFINDRLEIVGILHHVPILNELPRKVAKPSTYVIELLAGTAKEHEISEGDRLVVDGEVPVGR